MAFASSETINDKLTGCILPYNPARVKHGAYELSLGKEVFFTSESGKKSLKKRESFALPPGQFAILITAEKVLIPKDYIGLISIKASRKFEGLVNVSGFHVDPGFQGHLKFSVYNAGSRNIILERDEELFPLWFCELDSKTNDPYDGNHAGQAYLTRRDIGLIEGTIASPAALKKRLDKLEQNVKTLIAIAIALFVTIAVGIIIRAIEISS